MFVMTVPSSTEGKTYTVRLVEEHWVCDCKDSVYRSEGKAYTCRHVAELAASLFAHVSSAKMSEKAKGILALKP